MLPRSSAEFSATPMTDLDSKTVLVTGACGGIGKHLVEQLLSRQCLLMVTDLEPAKLNELPAAAAVGAGRVIMAHATDLSTADGCRQLVAQCKSEGLAPDVLINNAGIAFVGRHDHVPPDKWEALMNLNLLAPMRLSSAFVPGMVSQGGGHIVNVSSLAGWVGAANLSAYVASKFGLRGFGESLAAELRSQNIRVSGVYPSFTRTPMLESDQIGMGERKRVPENMVSEPADIVANIIKGIEKNRMHIFPDKTASRVHYLQRFAPWMIPILSRRLLTKA
ncbi:MAG: SDR family NAD(P)-dependent oxidoreductase [Woeseiaceae bacterium]